MDPLTYPRIIGFNTCANCGKRDNYYNHYSKEGLCKNCELNEYPERFYGCIFCRRPQRYEYYCLVCISGFSTWVEKNANIDEYLAASKLCYNDEKMIKNPFIKRDIDFYDKWSGFYIGDNKWEIYDVKMKTNRAVTFENSREVLEELLNENGIDIYAEIQLKV